MSISENMFKYPSCTNIKHYGFILLFQPKAVDHFYYSIYTLLLSDQSVKLNIQVNSYYAQNNIHPINLSKNFNVE